ncbi:MAG: hypothetical protein APF76_00750 [Desulfitibacter sp. BRH_c19]|nr:MAG: hypothetical protein APF76_00750 [Desulfitibacter sp. BRH_c19]
MKNYQFGYPTRCNACISISECELKVQPYFKNGGHIKLMLVGQDPTIFKKPERVKHVLMLDQENSQLSRWLKGIFGLKTFSNLTIYATNLVKCSFLEPPSLKDKGGLSFLKPHFENCKEHLKKELSLYRPTLVLTLGGPTHKLFRTALDDPEKAKETMKESFSGSFLRVRVNGFEFDYSPCLHIKTFRVAEVYGDSVKIFKGGLKKILKK